MPNKPYADVVVVGGGIAGLVTARVLADFFERVTLIEKDAIPPVADFRPGIPQGRHFHGLLPGGLLTLSKLLPGLTRELQAQGSLLPAPHEFYFYGPEGKSFALGAYMPEPPEDTGMRLLYVQTRHLLEHTLRAKVLEVENVQMRTGTRVVDILNKGGRVAGVYLDRGEEALPAELVIDASGRGSRISKWLVQLGFAAPREEVVNCDFAYTSVFLRPRKPELFQDVGFFVRSAPRGPVPSRGGALVRMEGGLWLVSCAGRYGDFPPADWEGFKEFAKSLSEGPLHELICEAEPATEPSHYRFKRSVRRRFEQLDAFPEGVLPIGDAICHYNPGYGQGMSAACGQAMALQQALDEAAARGNLDGLWRSFLPKAYEQTRAPWLFAAEADFLDPRCTGDFPEEERESLKLLQHIRGLAARGDAEASRTLRMVSSLIASLDALHADPWPSRLASHA